MSSKVFRDKMKLTIRKWHLNNLAIQNPMLLCLVPTFKYFEIPKLTKKDKGWILKHTQLTYHLVFSQSNNLVFFKLSKTAAFKFSEFIWLFSCTEGFSARYMFKQWKVMLSRQEYTEYLLRQQNQHISWYTASLAG